mgnify:CR=1 FL=1
MYTCKQLEFLGNSTRTALPQLRTCSASSTHKRRSVHTRYTHHAWCAHTAAHTATPPLPYTIHLPLVATQVEARRTITAVAVGTPSLHALPRPRRVLIVCTAARKQSNLSIGSTCWPRTRLENRRPTIRSRTLATACILCCEALELHQGSRTTWFARHIFAALVHGIAEPI